MRELEYIALGSFLVAVALYISAWRDAREIKRIEGEMAKEKEARRKQATQKVVEGRE
ncbi:MAG: hypothetical protein OEV91_03530 [Desulfobulbaceae bacterium]|nr:hypothetical protein [Desulfobulbaceae bacterium]